MLYLYAFVAAIAAISLEIFYRQTSLSFVQLSPLVVTGGLIIGYCVYNIITSTELFIEIAIIFPVGTMSGRILASYFVFGEKLDYPILSALTLVLAAQLVRVFFR